MLLPGDSACVAPAAGQQTGYPFHDLELNDRVNVRKRPSTAMLDQQTTAAVAGVLSNLAKSYDPAIDGSFTGQVAANGGKLNRIFLPGPESPTKTALELELSALAARVQYLEAKASTVNDNTFPITPGEPTVSSPFASGSPTNTPRTLGSIPMRHSSSASRDRTTWVENWLAKDAADEQQAPSTNPTGKQLGYLRDHLNKQAEQIKSQREHIDSLSAEVNRHLRDQDAAFGHGIEDIGALKRELGKHQQANLAFQKALREIGSIVTAVANGDLSKKVLIHAKELDPEITTFKRTINKMVDQLQDFASQVTHLAKEVGTEGRLGGQASLPGVDGIWAELTDSGASSTSLP